MGLHLVALAKLQFLSLSHSFTPLVAGALFPFVLKLSISLRIVRNRRLYIDVIDATRLFLFQLSQIASDADRAAATGNGDRCHRTLRLVCSRITHVRRPPAGQSGDEDSFHTLTMLSL
ncbi:hypothetical protein DITRI_Ditri07aG0153600 [Diplodiscus trichospermus]